MPNMRMEYVAAQSSTTPQSTGTKKTARKARCSAMNGEALSQLGNRERRPEGAPVLREGLAFGASGGATEEEMPVLMKRSFMVKMSSPILGMLLTVVGPR